MISPAFELNHRILVVDDNPAIHGDFRKILGPPSAANSALEAAEAFLFEQDEKAHRPLEFELSSAFQGMEGVELVRKSVLTGKRFAMAFVDVRMPPGIDGIETTELIWQADPDVQIVICSAFSDYSWAQMLRKLGQSDKLIILKKPFDNIEATQMATAFTAKWRLTQEARARVEGLEKRISEHASALEATREQLRKKLDAEEAAGSAAKK